MKHPYTDEQKLIIETTLKVGESIKVISGAGTGKTSTCAGYSEARPGAAIAYLAFNKSIAQQAEGRFPKYVQCSTVHSRAYKAEGWQFGKISGSISTMTIAIHYKVDYVEAARLAYSLENWFNSADPEIAVQHLVPPEGSDSLTEDQAQWMLEHCHEIWAMMKRKEKYFNMTHSGYLKLFQLSRPNFNVKAVLLDEAQDTNPVTWAIVSGQAAFGTRIVAVGDDFQAIYGFRGAKNAMAGMNCRTLYLTQSFRFGPAVAEMANLLLGHFYSPDWQLKGYDPLESKIVTDIDPKTPRTIIFRTNMEIFNKMHNLAVDKVPFRYNGDLSEVLRAIADVYYLWAGRPDRIESSKIKHLKSWTVAKRMAQLDLDLAAKMQVVDYYESRLERVLDIIRGAHQPDHPDAITLTTAHKSKGLEFDIVELSEDFSPLVDPRGKILPLTPEGENKFVKIQADHEDGGGSHEELRVVSVDPEDINLYYVAMTRAKKTLVINSQIDKFLKELSKEV